MHTENMKNVQIKINTEDDFLILNVNLDFTDRTEPNLINGVHNQKHKSIYFAHTWTKKDGSIETYNDALFEALNNGMNEDLKQNLMKLK